MESNEGLKICEVAVVIVNYNRLDDTIGCLTSLAEHCKAKEFTVILIDNNSAERIDKLFDMSFPFNFKIIKNDTNTGFASASNIGIIEAMNKECKYVFLLNNDTVIVNDVISALRNKLSSDDKLGIIGAVNYFYSAQEEIWCAGIRTNFKTGKNHSVEDFNRNDNEMVVVDYVPGSSLMIKTDILENVGFLDDNYFAYWEEVDLCFRVKENGYKVAFLANSKILHKVGKSSPSALKEYLRTRNKLYFYRKNFSTFDFLPVCIMILIRCFILSAFCLIKLKPLITFGYIAGILDFYRNKMGSNRVNFFLKG